MSTKMVLARKPATELSRRSPARMQKTRSIASATERDVSKLAMTAVSGVNHGEGSLPGFTIR